MKILFQGGWKEGRDAPETKDSIISYCESLADFMVLHNHQIVLASNRTFDKIIANRIATIAKEQGKNAKDYILFLLPNRIQSVPNVGRVKIFDTKWWTEERTYIVQQSDAVIAIGGGRGTFDCVEKALLSGKPVFVVGNIPCPAVSAWKRRSSDYKYFHEGDAEFQDDLNTTPHEFFSEMFKIINSYAEIRFTRRIFIVHGRDHHFKDSLVDLLKSLDFEPIVLQDEPSKSLTIIEKLERDTEQVGFSFVLYTPDDLGHLSGDLEKSRARQNVVFEHGLVIGLLGRERTCAIIKGDLEIPSDIQGMIYENIQDVKMDALKIARVLKQAGYTIDGTKLL